MKTVLEREVKILPEDNKTNIVLPFITDAAETMKITYSYSPKILEDGERARVLIEECLANDTGEYRSEYPKYTEYLPLKNLITLSLDSPEGYRGAAHRHDPEQLHVLSKNQASAGFLKGKITAGEWRLTLNVHAIVTEECVCKIKIEAGSDENG